MSVGAAQAGPFRGLVPFDEASGELFFGRAQDSDTLLRLVTADGARVTALTGESGVGKTSIIRAGLMPALVQRGILGIYVGAYEDLDNEILRATGRAGVDPPSPGETSPDYLARLARGSRGGTLLVLDHLEDALGDETGAGADLGALLARVAEAAGPRMRFLLSIDAAAFHRLDRLQASSGLWPAPGGWMTLEPLGDQQVSEILERTALQSGIFFEAGLSGVIAADLCRARPCLPADLQIVARAVLDTRLTSVRKFQRAGGAAMLRNAFLERACHEAGARSLKVLLDVASVSESSAEQVQQRTLLPRQRVEEALGVFTTRGLLRARRTARGDLFALIHPVLRARLESFAAGERARAETARRALRQRVMSGQRLSLREVLAVRRHLGAALLPEEEALVSGSLRRRLFQLGIGAFVAMAVLIALFFQLRTSYTLAYDPADGRAAARVVVRLGRPSLSFLYFMPNQPRFGAVLADTGFSAAGMADEVSRKIAAGEVSGRIESAPVPVPSWLREVLNGLRPVPRGVAMALLGDPSGVTSLRQGFTDQVATKRETLDALAVIGSGRAGEDEILARALSDARPEIRRRGVEVAAAISRRQGGHGHVATLRAALGDKAADVRAAVLRELPTMDPGDASSILAVALKDSDAAFRKTAEDATLKLAEKWPAAAADAARDAASAKSAEAAIRRGSLALLERIAASAPAESAAALGKLVADEKTPEDARVSALLSLRKGGSIAPELTPALEKAVLPEASPRLRAAALPLYARLIDPAKAEELARSEVKGTNLAKAAGAAVWGTVAMKHPEIAAQPLKSLIYDPSPDVRIEVARSLGYLKKDGLALVEKAMKDANTEVQRAAVESALALAPSNAYGVAELLGRTMKIVRPGARKTMMEALGRLGDTKPGVVINPLARALKEKDSPTRIAAATAFCSIAKKSAALVSPYLRMAARDDDDAVRTAAAACLPDLANGDPKGAAKMAAELAGASEPSVRAAAAEALGHLAGKTRDVSATALVKLIGDTERSVRTAAEQGLAAYGTTNPDAPLGAGKRAAETEKALATAMLQADPDERRLIVAAAAKNGIPSILRQAASDGAEAVRLEAVRAAGALTPPALDVVRVAVDDRANAVRAEATRILAAAGAGEVLPIFEAMLHGGDRAAREAAIIALGDLTGAGEASARLLGEVLGQRSESVRAAAARALGHLAARDPEHAVPFLEQALRDPSHDVRSAAIPGLALGWAAKKDPEELATILEGSEADSPPRFVALEALVIEASAKAPRKDAATKALVRISESGPPLARLAAQIGRGFLGADPAEMNAFLDRLLGG